VLDVSTILPLCNKWLFEFLISGHGTRHREATMETFEILGLTMPFFIIKAFLRKTQKMCAKPGIIGYKSGIMALLETPVEPD